jgi:hypothetical protein
MIAPSSPRFVRARRPTAPLAALGITREQLRMNRTSPQNDGALADEEGVGWVDAAAIRYHRYRCILMTARYVSLFISVAATMLLPNSKAVTCPPSSVGRAHPW